MKRSKQAAERPTSEGGPAAGDGDGDPLVARALRSAYEEAVKEQIPAEFLDLLSRLS